MGKWIDECWSNCYMNREITKWIAESLDNLNEFKEE